MIVTHLIEYISIAEGFQHLVKFILLFWSAIHFITVLVMFSLSEASYYSLDSKAKNFRFAVSRRSEPSSRTALTGEQTDPWDLLQPQDAMSRHRGSEPRRR